MATLEFVPATFEPPTTLPTERFRLYPDPTEEHDVSVQSWVRASHADLDGPLADALVDWIAADWPWEQLDRYGR